MSSQKWLPLIFIILTSLSGLSRAQNYGCFGDVNYTSNGTYSTNLNTLLSSLSSNINDTGFYIGSEGQSPNLAYASALCRSDFQLNECRGCIQNATTELLQLCPNRRQGVLFKDDICTLRYSDEPMLGILSDGYIILAKKQSNASSPDLFNESLKILLEDLRRQASSGGALMKIGAGDRSGPNFQAIFGLLQCSPDLSSEDCTSCLIAATQYICCDNKTGVTVYMQSCYLQYQTGPFYNMTRIEEVRTIISAPPPVPVSVPVPQLPSPPGNGSGNTTKIVIIILVPSVLCLLLLVGVIICVRNRLNNKPQEIIANDGDEEIDNASLLYDFAKIRAATNDFSDSNKLGEGGFGAVYKGKIQNGGEIAVKRLSKGSRQGDLEFKNEVILMAKLQHRNLARLLGFSLEGTERLLIYEFLPNSSLDRFIFDPIKRLHFDWDMRYKIIRGIARGLLYLHEDSRFRIIHRDLKASNILLDDEMNPKIADFGTARLFVQDQSGVNTSRIVGTYGYMSPEYLKHGQISVKLDVFSFGVLLLEIVSGRKNSSFKNVVKAEDMLSFAWKSWCEGTTTNMIDPVLLRSTSSSVQDILRCIHVGLLCVQENAADRPTMASVVLMLNSFTMTLSVPSQPAFFVPKNHYLSNISEERKLDQSSHSSRNDASISELYPR